MRRGVVRKLFFYWLCGCAVTLLVAMASYGISESPISKKLLVPFVARGLSPNFPDGSIWEWEEERGSIFVVVRSWVRSDDELKSYQFGALRGFEVVDRPRWWCYGMERLMPPPQDFVRDHDVPFVVDRAYGWPIVSLSSRIPGPELLREMAEGRRADDGQLLGVGSEGLPRARIGWEHEAILSRWGWNDGIWPTRVLWPAVIFGGAWWGVLLAVPELIGRGWRAWRGTKKEECAVIGEAAIQCGPKRAIARRCARLLLAGGVCAIGSALVPSAFEAVWPFRENWEGKFAFGEGELKENGRAWRWTEIGALARTVVNSEIADAARFEQLKGSSYEGGVATVGPAPWWSISSEQPVPPVLHGPFDEMPPNVTDTAFGFPWRSLAHRIEYYDIRFNKGMRGTPPVTAGMGRTSGTPLLTRGVRIEMPVLGGVVNSGWWPTRILWPGFVANIIFWTAMCWGTLAAWRGLVWIKEERRRRRGQCAGCGYDMGAIRVGGLCPECGRERGCARSATTSLPV